ncbi:TetR/AcrR family transcriptional regulator [Streptomyces sp. NBC_01304]|uniref:TetR/AcrR family transcriptional regulator n=1 Tax=Streptomyces sp. NBC_01304 TaxID=2903818 RepID=UPI002E148AE0|nr:TetR/AcrR family transcriptional regulator [Streptomyces sp. NBC_01304]
MAGQRAPSGGGPEPVTRMRRAERREQILGAASRAFARTGYTATGLDEVAAEAGITKVLLYRHFESKADLYRAALDRACGHLAESVGSDNFDDNSIPALIRAASADPDGFRLLFHHAAREPEFRDLVDTLSAASSEVAQRNLAQLIPVGPWLDWAARVIPAFTTEAVIAWLDAGQPDPEQAAARISQAVHGVIQAAVPATDQR